MKYKGEVTLRNGETVLLRSLCPQDAQQTLHVIRKAAGETPYMMRYEDEWALTPQKESELLADMLNAPKALMLGAFVGGHLVGVGNFRPVHPGDRARHRAELGISILKSHWGMGIGTAVMHALIGAAQTTALEQLELDVVSTNEAAVRLYRRCGFEEYGRRLRAMKYRDGTYADTVLMMLELRKRK